MSERLDAHVIEELAKRYAPGQMIRVSHPELTRAEADAITYIPLLIAELRELRAREKDIATTRASGTTHD